MLFINIGADEAGRIWAAQETIGGDIIIEALEQKDERKTGND